MRRRRTSDSSSLELLLDTITNTFGGVLFVAILVVILLRLAHQKQAGANDNPAVSQLELLRSQTELERLMAQRQQLLQSEALRQQLQSQFASPEKRQKLETLQDVRQTRDELVEDRLQTLNSIAQMRQETTEIEQSLELLDEELMQADKAVAEAKAALDSEIDLRTTSTELPVARFTRKMEIPIVVQYGRFYVPHRYEEGLLFRSANLDEMLLLVDESTEVYVTPKPYAGIPIESHETFSQQISQRLHQFDPHSTYIAIAIWEDSFDHFEALKNIIVKLGYDYRLIPVQTGGQIHEGYVDDIRVQ